MKKKNIYQDYAKTTIKVKATLSTWTQANMLVNYLRSEFPDNEEELDDYYIFLEEISFTQAKNAYIKAFNNRLEAKGLLK